MYTKRCRSYHEHGDLKLVRVIASMAFPCRDLFSRVRPQGSPRPSDGGKPKTCSAVVVRRSSNAEGLYRAMAMPASAGPERCKRGPAQLFWSNAQNKGYISSAEERAAALGSRQAGSLSSPHLRGRGLCRAMASCQGRPPVYTSLSRRTKAHLASGVAAMTRRQGALCDGGSRDGSYDCRRVHSTSCPGPTRTVLSPAGGNGVGRFLAQ